MISITSRRGCSLAAARPLALSPAAVGRSQQSVKCGPIVLTFAETLHFISAAVKHVTQCRTEPSKQTILVFPFTSDQHSLGIGLDGHRHGRYPISTSIYGTCRGNSTICAQYRGYPAVSGQSLAAACQGTPPSLPPGVWRQSCLCYLTWAPG